MKKFLQSTIFRWVLGGTIAAMLGSMVGFGVWIANLRVAAARCQATPAVQLEVETLRDKVKADRSGRYDDIRETIENISDDCLDQLDPSVRDNGPVVPAVPDPATTGGHDTGHAALGNDA